MVNWQNKRVHSWGQVVRLVYWVNRSGHVCWNPSEMASVGLEAYFAAERVLLINGDCLWQFKLLVTHFETFFTISRK